MCIRDRACTQRWASMSTNPGARLWELASGRRPCARWHPGARYREVATGSTKSPDKDLVAELWP
eukprot:2776138-Alexandrium_andersonii.AAC.1